MRTKQTNKRPSRTRRRRTAILAAIAVLVVATMVLARYASRRTASAAPNTPAEVRTASAPEAAPVPVAAVGRPHVARAAVEKPKQTPAAPAGESASKIVIAPTADAADEPPVTITGCLETTVDEGQFRLTDIEGADAPQARSWRSAFLKKRAAPVQLVELSDPHGLRKYVGRRVVATGLLTSGELRVRSLRSAGASCN